MKLILFLLISCGAVAFAQQSEYGMPQSEQGSPVEYQQNTNSADFSDYQSNYKLRQDRKLGAGVSVGGALGGLGGFVELNIEDVNSTIAGFGSGPGYQTFAIAWKQSFEGEYFTPYTTLGYAHWWKTGSTAQVNRSALLKNFLSDRERAKNDFGLDLVTGSLGMQYNQLSGDLAGSSFYIELGGLLSAQNTKLMPTGAVGALYYF